MKIRIWSDLHADGAPLNFSQPCHDEVLILAGDTANGIGGLAKTVKQLAPLFRHVIVVPGNHEYYRGTPINTFVEEYNDVAYLPNVSLIQTGTLLIDDVTFICATLWSDFDQGNPVVEIAAQRGINDFRLIHVSEDQPVDPLWMRKQCAQDITYIRNQCKATTCKKVVITHFPPSRKFQHPRWGTMSQNPLNGYFMSDLDRLIEDIDFDIWVCGHTHDGIQFEQDGKRFICNPRGYHYAGKDENQFFDINLVVDL